jgi:hypothetical protein
MFCEKLLTRYHGLLFPASCGLLKFRNLTDRQTADFYARVGYEMVFLDFRVALAEKVKYN